MASGLFSSIGYGVETGGWGVPVAATRFMRFTNESMEKQKGIVQGAGLGGNFFLSAADRAMATNTAAGQITMDVPDKGFGMILKQALGSAASPIQQGASTAYLQTHQLGSPDGQSLTIQKLVKDDTTLRPFTYNGSKLASLELACQAGGLLTAAFDVDSQVETQGGTGVYAAQTPSYLQSRAFHFGLANVTTVGGTASTTGGVVSVTGGTQPAMVTGFSIKITWPMATDRYPLGSSGLKREQLVNDRPTITGSLTAEFNNVNDLYLPFSNDTASPLHIQIGGATSGSGVGRNIAGAYNYMIDIVCPAIYFDGESPKIGGAGLVPISANFSGLSDGANNALQIAYQSSDATI